MRQRYYDSSLGRWLSQDPIGFQGGLNLYTYVGQNPIGRVDPSGLQPPGLTTNNLDWPTATTTTVPPQGYRNECDNVSIEDAGQALLDTLMVAGLAALALETAPFVGVALMRVGLGRIGVPLLVNSYRLQGFSPFALLGLTRGNGDRARATGQRGVFQRPRTLRGVCPNDTANLYRGSGNWSIEAMKRSSRASGMTVRETVPMKNGSVEYGDKYIQYHPGSPRHYDGAPYYKVSSGTGGTDRFPAETTFPYTGGYDR